MELNEVRVSGHEYLLCGKTRLSILIMNISDE